MNDLIKQATESTHGTFTGYARKKENTDTPEIIRATHYTQREAIAKTGLCFNSFKKLVDAGEIKRVKFGRKYYIHKADFEAFVKHYFAKNKG
ncbi:MAG: helix-turn-helix domain-containing protein [Fibrobacter sp.]|nr:helix-turn-helix domain-containing protein [Fibrobacter sp.]